MGKPGFPLPLRESQALLRAEYGGTWFPYVHVRPHARGAQRPMQPARERGRDTRGAAPRAR